MFRLEVIDFVDPTGNTVVSRVPSNGTAAIQLGAQLIVQQNQEAVFFRDGRAMDVFGPGRHTLLTSSLPLLSRLLTVPWDRAPFQACVYFVGKQRFIDQGWGTRQPITIQDPEFGAVRLRGFGKYSFRVTEASLLVNEIVGSQGKVTTQQITEYLRDIVVSGLSDLLASTNLGLAQMASKFDELAAAARVKIGQQFKKLGLELTDLMINNVSPPEEVQKAMDARSSLPAARDLHSYTIHQAKKTPGSEADPSSSGISSKSSRDSQSTAEIQEMIRNAAGQTGWTIAESAQQWKLTLALGPLTKQDVHVDFSGTDEAGHRIVSIWATCGELDVANALALLRHNAQIIHGAFAVIRAEGADVLVIRGNLLADTADPLELTRTITAVAWQANQIDRQKLS